MVLTCNMYRHVPLHGVFWWPGVNADDDADEPVVRVHDSDYRSDSTDNVS